MSAMRDLAEHLGIFSLHTAAQQTVGGPTNLASVDTWNAGMGIGCNFLAILEVGTLGTSLDVVIQDSPDNATWTLHTTLTQIVATGQYYKPITHCNRYVRAVITMGGTCIFSITLLADRSRRVPHTQTGTLV